MIILCQCMLIGLRQWCCMVFMHVDCSDESVNGCKYKYFSRHTAIKWRILSKYNEFRKLLLSFRKKIIILREYAIIEARCCQVFQSNHPFTCNNICIYVNSIRVPTRVYS